MTAPTRTIRVEYKEGSTGLIYATSPDLKGLLVAKPTMDELVAAVPEAIADLFAAAGVDEEVELLFLPLLDTGEQ